jgi:hypothetical protein
MDSGWLVLLGAVVGAAAGVAGQLITANLSNRSDRRRLAVEAGFREWEQNAQMAQLARAEGRPAQLFPPVLFVLFNYDFLRCLDEKDGLTQDKYRDLLRRKEQIKAVILEATRAAQGGAGNAG